ncbi:AAA family ATPase [Paenibacillus agricola]|uniref:AAA family ATPase n=1 Tax=Paenibacillus agricola TaxID=2716264 RepID=A0ABX0JCD0_9BACL|nr:AAA family ATPase [Paenibacillus agricola]NHN31869.1 AAA family ATPase [Paenibacillus agricola]
MKRTVYLISGPAGAGKSTTSRKIAEILEKSAYIEGDFINHMVVGGHEKPWLSETHLNLIWLNMLSLTRNYLVNDYDVIIDYYVTYSDKTNYMLEALKDFNIDIKFIVLLVDKDELLRRDSQRPVEDQMGERCIIGLNEIIASNPPERHIMNTTQTDIEQVVDDILRNPKYLLNPLS